MTLLQKALKVENSELASEIEKWGMKAQALPFDPSAFAKWQELKPQIDAKWQALADEFNTTTDKIFDLLDEYYENQ